jgi:hypothetical protein
MPSARLKLVKLAAPSASAATSPFCSNKPDTCALNFKRSIVLSSDFCESGDCQEAVSCSSSHVAADSLRSVPLPPQRHHFSKKSDWMCNYRRWLKKSKAIWFQRLHNQQSILQFFTSGPPPGPTRPRAFATKRVATNARSQIKLKNSTLEAYGARAGSFKTSRCCKDSEIRQTQPI